MPLLNLRTDLKSLKYGRDRFNGGSSGQPYIQSPIPDNENPSIPMDDGFVRGGIIGAQAASAKDNKRISLFLKDKPKGPLFIARQVGLQLTNPRLEVKKGLGGLFDSLLSGDLGPLTGGLLQPTRLYNLGVNTLAQVSINAFGRHYERHGLLPIQDESTKYLSVAKYNNENDKNRLVDLSSKLLIKRPDSTLSRLTNWINNAAALFRIPIRLPNFTPKELIIDKYLGGPGSTYGIGNTLIKRYDFTGDARYPNKKVPQKRSTIGGNPSNINYTGTLGVSDQYFENYTEFIPPAKRTDPASGLNFIGGIGANVTHTKEAQLEDYNNLTFNEPNKTPSQLTQTAVVYTAGAKKYSDLRNAITNLTSFTSSSIDARTGRIKGLDSTATGSRYYGTKKVFDSGSIAIYDNTLQFDRHDSDIMTISFQAINPFGDLIADPVTGLKGEEWLFSAYMKGFKDNFTATWNEANYVGRAESFYIYNKFNRDVSFNLDIPCFNKLQLYEKHRALGQLAATTAGSYNGAGLLGGVFLKINVGKYLLNQYAILKSLSYDIPDDSSWDIDEKLAMYLKASFSLTIIHSGNKPPQYELESANSASGFFGYLPNQTNQYLQSDYKAKYLSSVTKP